MCDLFEVLRDSFAKPHQVFRAHRIAVGLEVDVDIDTAGTVETRLFIFIAFVIATIATTIIIIIIVAVFVSTVVIVIGAIIIIIIIVIFAAAVTAAAVFGCHIVTSSGLFAINARWRISKVFAKERGDGNLIFDCFLLFFRLWLLLLLLFVRLFVSESALSQCC
jgi:hypothetical protein